MATPASNFETVLVRAPQRPTRPDGFSVTSESFNDGDTIGMDFVFTGCGGKNHSPQLSWRGAPAGTKSYAITCFDPDAPTGSGYWHWLAFDIPASTSSIAAKAGTDRSPSGGRSGYNDFSAASYCGPCPPKGDGPHRYVFTVYALDVESLDGADEGTTGSTVIFQMRGHVLASASLVCRFGH